MTGKLNRSLILVVWMLCLTGYAILAQTAKDLTTPEIGNIREKTASGSTIEGSYFCTNFFRGKSQSATLDINSSSLSLKGATLLQIGNFDFKAEGLLINYSSDELNKILDKNLSTTNSIEKLDRIDLKSNNITIAGSTLEKSISIINYAEPKKTDLENNTCKDGLNRRSEDVIFFGTADSFEWQKKADIFRLKLIGRVTFIQKTANMRFTGSEFLLDLDYQSAPISIKINNKFSVFKDGMSASANRAVIDLVKKRMIIQENVVFMFKQIPIFETEKLDLGYEENKQFIYTDIPQIQPFLIR